VTTRFRPDSGGTNSPSPPLYRRDDMRPKAPHQLHCLADAYRRWSDYLSDRVVSNRLEDSDELGKPPIIRIARRTIAVRIDPLRMLRHQIPMQLVLQISIRPNLTPVRPQLS